MTAYAAWIIVALLAAGGLLVLILYRRLKAPQRPDYLARYAEHVMSACAQMGTSDAVIEAIVKRHENPDSRDSITWGELFVVESHLLSRLSEPELRRRAWSLRERFREVAGPRQFDSYQLSRPPSEQDLPAAELPLLRADLERLLDALHWSYALIPVRERIRTQIISAVSGQVVAWTIVVVGLLVWSATRKQTFLAALACVFLAGAMGGFISLLRRIQMVPTGGDPLLSIFELENGRVSLYLAPLSGAVFAVLLFFIFQGGLVEGALFPKLTKFRLHILQFQWDEASPVYTEFAKLMVWAFIAGFAERFVPDTLARLVQRGEEAASTPATPPPPGTQGTGTQTRVGSPPAVQGNLTASPPSLGPVRTRIASPPFR
jgi:hypothetical protein